MEEKKIKGHNSHDKISPEKSLRQKVAKDPFIPAQQLVIKDPNVIPSFNHEKKQILLKILLREAKTIMELSNATGINPGTVKRHISDLQNKGIVVIARTQINQKRILLKYYRSAALHFIFHFEWPYFKS